MNIVGRIGIVRTIAALVVLIALDSTAMWQSTVQTQQYSTETPTGICGRTSQVRAAILARLSGVSGCANVKDTHLSDITGDLDLNA